MRIITFLILILMSVYTYSGGISKCMIRSGRVVPMEANNYIVYPTYMLPASPTSATSPTSVVNVEMTGLIWNNPDHAMASDDSYAITDGMDWNTCDAIFATDFDFALPNSTVDGIIVEIEKSNPYGGAPNFDEVFDDVLSLFVDGSQKGFGKSNPTQWPVADTYVSYGTSVDKWSATWTETDINSSTFGCSFICFGAPSAYAHMPQGYIDHIRITVYYTEVTDVPKNIYMGITF